MPTIPDIVVKGDTVVFDPAEKKLLAQALKRDNVPDQVTLSELEALTEEVRHIREGKSAEDGLMLRLVVMMLEDARDTFRRQRH